jgi:two-component system, OmpR family, phosphate regulon response regulator PhoB
MITKTISSAENMTFPMLNIQKDAQPSKRVLIVEDQLMVSEMLKVILQSKGYGTVIASDFLSAQEHLEKEAFALVLLDLNLPNGNGLDLLKQARTALDLDTPIIILSALKQEMNILSGLKLGANDYITKPFSPRELLMRIAKVLG